VVVDDALYVRAYNGKSSRWYQAALRQKAGRITAAGMTTDVTFAPVDGIDQRSDRRCISGEVQAQPIPETVTFEPGTNRVAFTSSRPNAHCHRRLWMGGSGPVEEIHPGDVVWFAPNEEH